VALIRPIATVACAIEEFWIRLNNGGRRNFVFRRLDFRPLVALTSPRPANAEGTQGSTTLQAEQVSWGVADSPYSRRPRSDSAESTDCALPSRLAPYRPGAERESSGLCESTPAFRIKYAVEGDRAHLYFECLYVDKAKNNIAAHTNSDDVLVRVNGKWLIKDMKASSVPEL
jgi:hypothetical protein